MIFSNGRKWVTGRSPKNGNEIESRYQFSSLNVLSAWIYEEIKRIQYMKVKEYGRDSTKPTNYLLKNSVMYKLLAYIDKKI